MSQQLDYILKNDMRYFLFSMTVMVLCLSCGQKQKGNLDEVNRPGADIRAENTLGPEDTDIDYDRLTDGERERIIKMRQDKEDSIIVNVKFPKPEVKLVCNGDKERAVAKRVQTIYDDVLETRNYMRHEDKDIFKPYWSKSLYAGYEKACKQDDAVFGADPYTGSQEHIYAHLYKVAVVNMSGSQAIAKVTFGIYGKDEVYMNDDMTLSLVFEQGDWYIDDMRNGDMMSVRETMAND